jgi:hypothetical protein
MGGRHHDDAVRITTAAPSPAAEIAGRQRRYLISMGIRTLCVIGAVVVDGPLRWALIVGAIFLPYVAVVMANATNHKEDPYALPESLRQNPELGNPGDT